MNDQSIPKFKRGFLVSCTLVALVILCSLVLASDSVQPDVPDEWIIPSAEDHGAHIALWNECQKIQLVFSEVRITEGEDADRLGLTKEAVQTLFESRLRAARLFSANERYDSGDVRDALWVTVYAGVGSAFYWNLGYHRWLDLGFGEHLSATIWSYGTYGTHGYNKASLVQDLSEAVDYFILKYLTVNEQACEDKD